MFSFKQFLLERFKSEHEPWLRNAASYARQEMTGPKYKTDFMKYGSCYNLSCRVAAHIKDKYPSARVVSSHSDRNRLDHSWVEIPEINHYIDPTHDQHSEHMRNNAPIIKGNYPDNLIKIGAMDDHYHGSLGKNKIINHEWEEDHRENIELEGKH